MSEVKMTDQEILKRQWLEALGPGWPCEVWPDEKIIKKLMYFSVMKLENCYFVKRDIEIIGRNNTPEDYLIYSENYRPLSTPLDFAPEWSEKIQFYSDGSFKFTCRKRPVDYDNYKDWSRCPERMRGKIFRIPDDWRPI